jgi:phage terminase large subunit
VGKIYTEWDDNVHIVNRYEYNPEWDNYLFFDFGFENPFVALDVQISPSEDVYVWREYYVKNLPVHMHAQHLVARSNPDNYTIRAGFGDAADPGALETLSMMVVSTFGDPESKKDVTRGIQEVKKFLRDRTGQAHLFIDKSCASTIWEFQNYRFKQTQKGEENSPDAPKKWADHSLDAIRYGLMHLFVLGARYHLSDVVGTVPLRKPLPNREDESGPNPSQRGGSFFTREVDSAFVLGGSREF